MVANLLGATGLLISDVVEERIAGTDRRSRSTVAALVAMHYFGPLTVTQLGRCLHLSQPAATRLLQALEAEGLCRREGSTGRAVAVTLTEAGEDAVSDALGARQQGIEGMLASLNPAEITDLGRLLGKLLTAGFTQYPDERYLCRLCARDRCGDAETRCPVGHAAERAADFDAG